MATQTREQGRYLGGRPPSGYRLADAGPHPNKAHAVSGRRAHRLEPDPHTAPVVRWMFAQRLAGHSVARITPADEQAAVDALLRQLDFHSGELSAVSRELAAEALADPVVARLMTIPGVDALTAISIVAAAGDFTRFASPGQLVSYLGLNPKVRQSGSSPAAVHGRISKAGRSQVRGVLVGAAWSACRTPGPLRAFYQRIYARRGYQTAVVATARKLTVLAWHLATRDEDYAFARPGLVAHKRRKLELTAGYPSRQGSRSQPASAYSSKQRRDQERQAAQQAERAYQVLVAHWQQKRPAAARGPA